MTFFRTTTTTRRPRRVPPAGPAGALVAVAALFFSPSAPAERAPGAGASDTVRSAPVSAPAPASAPSVATAPRSAPAPSHSAPSPSASPRSPERSGRGTVSAEPREGRGGGSASATAGGGGGRIPGVRAAHPRGSSPGRPRHPRRRYYSPYTSWGGTSWWWGGPWDWWWWGGRYGPYWGWGGVVIVEDYDPDAYRYARIDTDVNPESAEVYLDGTYIGSADDFDGYPDYLYLEAGKYKLEFRHPSYETATRELNVRQGQALRFTDDLKLEPGKKRLEAVDPERRGTPHGRVFGKPDEKSHRDRTGRFEATAKTGDDRDEEVEDRDEMEELERDLEAELEEGADEDLEPAPKAPSGEKERSSGGEALPAERGRIRFEVEPEDAAVYLDDRYVGTGEELAGLRRGVPVDAGRHTVSVVRPGYVTKTIDVEAKKGSAIDVVVELEK